MLPDEPPEAAIMKTIDTYRSRKSKTAWITALILSLPAMAMAHPGHDGHGDAMPALCSGLLHPLSGIDHMMLALAMGWLAILPGARKAKLPAIAFLSALVVGALCGRWTSGGTGLEIAISLTLLAAGAVMMRERLRRAGMFCMLAVAGGLVHGLAHGAEALPGASFLMYGFGLLATTALLLGAGGCLQRMLSRSGHPQLAVRMAGAVVIACGVTFLIRIF